MTKEETKHMDTKFKEQGDLIRNLTAAVQPMAIKIAIVEERQKEHPRVNKLYAVVGGLITFVIALLAVVATLIAVSGK